MSTNSSAQGAANSSDKVFNDSLFQCVKRRCSRRLWILNARKLLYTSGITFVALSMSTVAVDSIYAVINAGGGHHVPRYLPSLLVAIVATVTTTALTSRILKLRKGYCVGGLDVFVMEVLKGLAAWSWVGLLESCVLQFDGNNNNDDGNDDGGGSGGGGSGSDDDGDDDEGGAGHLSNLKKLKTAVAVLGIALALTPFYLGGARVGREVLGASERVKVKLNSFEVTVWSYVLGFSTHLFFRTLVAGVLFKRTMYLSGLVGLVFFLELFVAGRFIVEMQERATRLAPESRAYALPSCLVAFDLLCESLSVTVAFACLSQFHALYGLLLFTCLGNEAPLVDDTVWVDLSSADDSYGVDDVDREGGDFGKRGDDVVTGPQVLLGVAWLASAFCSSLLVYTVLAATALGPAPLPEVTTTTILTPAEGGGGGSGSDGGSGVGVGGSYCCCRSDSSSSSSSSSSNSGNGNGNGNGNGGRDKRQRRQGGGGGGGGRFEERAALVVIGSSNYHDDDDGGNAGGGDGGDSGFHGSDNGDSYEEENEETGIGEQDDDRYDEDGDRGDDNEDEDEGGRALWARARRDTLRRRNALLLNAAALAVGYCGSKFLGLAVALTFASSSTSSTSSSIGALLLRFSAAVSVASLLALAHARQRIFRERQAAAAAAATTLSSNRQHLHPFHYDLEDGANNDLERQLRDATTQFAMLQDHLLSLQQDDSNSGLNATWSSAVSSSSNGHHPHRPQSKKRRLRRQRFGYMEGDDEDALSEDEDDFEELFDDGLADEEAAADAAEEAAVEGGRLSLADGDEAEGSDVGDEGDDDDDSDDYDSFGSSRGGVRSSDDSDEDDDDNAVAGTEERNGGATNSREYHGVDDGGDNGEQERSSGTRVGKDEGQGHKEDGEGNGEEDVDASVRSNQWRHEESGMSLQRTTTTTTTSDLSGGLGGVERSGQAHSSLGRSSNRGIGSQLLAAPPSQGEWL